MFAATSAAELKVSAAEGCTVWYTTDGSDPVVNGATVKKADGTISVSPGGNTDKTITVKAISEKDGKSSEITEKTLQFIAIPEQAAGTKVYLGQAQFPGVNGGPYPVKVRVTTIDGTIARVEDNGTAAGIEDAVDGAFWEGGGGVGVMSGDADSMPAKLKGRTMETVLSMKTTPDVEGFNVDAVSSATVCSDAVKYAVVDALRSAPVHESDALVLAPVLYTDAPVAPNASYESIRVAMGAEKGAVIRYTLDGTDPDETSPEAAEIGWSGDAGVELKPDLEDNPDGQAIEVRAAAFRDGMRSDVTRQIYVFALPLREHTYQTGTYTGTSGDLSVTVTVDDPRFSGTGYVTKIVLDETHPTANAAFLPDLLSRIYLAQTTDGVSVENGWTGGAQILAAVETALESAVRPSEPSLTVSPDKTSYANDEQAVVMLGCATEGAKIYYTVDNSNTLPGSTLSDPTKNGLLYEEPLSVSIENEAGGTVYIRAAAKLGETWSSIVRKDIDFVKAVKKDAFSVNGENYSSWDAAVAAINEQGGGTLVLGDNVELTDDAKLPSTACTIRSAEGQSYTLKGSALYAQADLTLENLTYDINRLYANGHDLTIGENVDTVWSFAGRVLYAGGKEDVQAETVALSVQSGEFAVYASGLGKTTLEASVNVYVGGTAEVELAGAYMGAAVNGDVSFTVDGDGVSFFEFLGEQNGGSISGALTLKIIGAPTLSTWRPTYKASVNREFFGTLDLTEAGEGLNTSNFTGFKKVLTNSGE